MNALEKLGYVKQATPSKTFDYYDKTENVFYRTDYRLAIYKTRGKGYAVKSFKTDENEWKNDAIYFEEMKAILELMEE